MIGVEFQRVERDCFSIRIRGTVNRVDEGNDNKKENEKNIHVTAIIRLHLCMST